MAESPAEFEGTVHAVYLWRKAGQEAYLYCRLASLPVRSVPLSTPITCLWCVVEQDTEWNVRHA